MNTEQIIPQAEQQTITEVARSPQGALYTSDFVPKFIGESGIYFILFSNGLVGVYREGEPQAVIQASTADVSILSLGSSADNRIDLRINNQDYIYRVVDQVAASAGLGGVAGSAVGLGMLADKKAQADNFFTQVASLSGQDMQKLVNDEKRRGLRRVAIITLPLSILSLPLGLISIERDTVWDKSGNNVVAVIFMVIFAMLLAVGIRSIVKMKRLKQS